MEKVKNILYGNNVNYLNEKISSSNVQNILNKRNLREYNLLGRKQKIKRKTIKSHIFITAFGNLALCNLITIINFVVAVMSSYYYTMVKIKIGHFNHTSFSLLYARVYVL